MARFYTSLTQKFSDALITKLATIFGRSRIKSAQDFLMLTGGTGHIHTLIDKIDKNT
ncbi:MAG: hypothetical protein WC244_02915 [Patescibacteria group bacterium]|jgi:hypothetical protein